MNVYVTTTFVTRMPYASMNSAVISVLVKKAIAGTEKRLVPVSYTCETNIMLSHIYMQHFLNLLLSSSSSTRRELRQQFAACNG